MSPELHSSPRQLALDDVPNEVNTQQECTLNVPPELVLGILDHLPPESVIAFALTCRAFFRQYFPRPLPRLSHWQSARATLLQWLEKDTPELYYCPGLVYCRQHLHVWKLERLSTSGLKHLVEFGTTLTYTLARLTMNRHLYGPGHGPSVEEIAITNDRNAYGKNKERIDEVDIVRSWAAKIIRNRLFLFGTFTIRSPSEHVKDQIQHLRAFLHKHRNILICRHVDTRKPAIIPFHEQGRGMTSRKPVQMSCPICFTDYQVQAMDHWDYGNQVGFEQPPKREKDFIIRISRWHNLGPCRYRRDREWHLFMT
ncbi:hypothetical protein QBC34DRAFT_323050, partial [Podospora aff. communis PSN243]